MIQWIAKDTGLSMMDTYQLVSRAARSRIANVCDANYTIVANVPRRFLPSGYALDPRRPTEDALAREGDPRQPAVALAFKMGGSLNCNELLRQLTTGSGMWYRLEHS